MHSSDRDPLTGALTDLAVAAPDNLLDRIVARWTRVPAPIGDVYVASTDRGIAYLRTAAGPDEFSLSFRERFARPLLPADRPPAGLLPALRSGRPRDLTFDLSTLTSFEQDVLHTAMTIPHGELRPYGWVARQIGRPKAVRAVGTALARNPVPLLIPCHRVIRSDGATGQYVFGAPAKELLLRGEDANLDEMHDLAARNIHYVASDTTGIVCFPTCHNARRITAAHRHGFRTLPQAEAAGYRPCKHCRPGA